MADIVHKRLHLPYTTEQCFYFLKLNKAAGLNKMRWGEKKKKKKSSKNLTDAALLLADP